ncbi:MAG: hypothetical protein LBC73_09380 [Oscillospiraceae bacterium]|jgi:lipopolysaccharide biosynthesis glycosyltransferase|nr:hypothetical protein [Oscillospiraceae bacterium]
MKRKRINIMTSSDETYAKLIPVQLYSIADNLVSHPLNYEVHFYFFYSRVSDETIDCINKYCNELGIIFNKILIEDAALYEELATKGGVISKSGSWPYEAYFTLECHKYLPVDIDRIIYIDAADVLILGDISDYYFGDFESCSLIVTAIRYKSDGVGGLKPMERDDLSNDEHRLAILRGIFNSGSFVINLEKMRQENMSIYDYIALKDALVEIYPDKDEIYFGDQGLIAAALVGDIKYFDYPTTINLWYQPYNFCIWFFDRASEVCGGNPWYIPRILHFAGGIKPWLFNYENEKNLKPGQWPFYKIYNLYANQVSNTL